MVRAVRKRLQTIALLTLAHFGYERAGVSQFVSQFVSHSRLHPFALAVNLQDALDASAKVVRARTGRAFREHSLAGQRGDGQAAAWVRKRPLPKTIPVSSLSGNRLVNNIWLHVEATARVVEQGTR